MADNMANGNKRDNINGDKSDSINKSDSKSEKNDINDKNDKNDNNIKNEKRDKSDDSGNQDNAGKVDNGVVDGSVLLSDPPVNSSQSMILGVGLETGKPRFSAINIPKHLFAGADGKDSKDGGVKSSSGNGEEKDERKEKEGDFIAANSLNKDDVGEKKENDNEFGSNPSSESHITNVKRTSQIELDDSEVAADGDNAVLLTRKTTKFLANSILNTYIDPPTPIYNVEPSDFFAVTEPTLSIFDAQVPKHRFKVLIKGKSAVGKTCFVNNLCGKDVPSRHASTLGLQVSVVNWLLNGKDGIEEIELNLYDGNIDGLTILPDCILYLVSAVDQKSLEFLQDEEIETKVKCVVLTKYSS